MTAGRKKIIAEAVEESAMLQEAMAPFHIPVDHDFDLSLLEDSLAKTPWERMQANDDALNFAELLRGTMEKRNAKP